MDNFTPYSALAGGLLIGLSATIMLLFNGRVTGISGIFSALFTPKAGEWLWRLVFLFGIMAGALVFISIFPDSFIPRTDFPLAFLIIGGFLVGFGTNLGNGCTSGHGICGIARRSPRSLIATLVFMASGSMTVFIIRHLFNLSS